MIISSYTPIKENDAIDIKSMCSEFMDDHPIIDYMAVGVQNKVTGRSFSYMTRPEWQRCFYENNYASIDPVRYSIFHSQSSFLAYDEVDFMNLAGSEVMEKRKKYYITNGFILTKRYIKYNYAITFGTGYKRFSPRQFYIKNNREIEKFIDLIFFATKKYPAFYAI